MTSQRILEMSLGWKSMARSVDPNLEDKDRTYNGQEVKKLLNGLIDWLVAVAQMEEKDDLAPEHQPGAPYQGDLEEIDRLSEPEQKEAIK